MIKFSTANFFFSAGAMVLFAWLARLQTGAAQAMRDAAYLSAGFGFTMAFVAGSIHVMLVRRLAEGRGQGGDIYTVFQRRELRTALAPDRVFAVMKHYLAEVARLNLLQADQAAGLLKAGSAFNFITYGYRMSVEIKPEPAGGTLVVIASSPRFRTILMDFGENLKAVMKAADYLAASSHQERASI